MMVGSSSQTSPIIQSVTIFVNEEGKHFSELLHEELDDIADDYAATLPFDDFIDDIVDEIGQLAFILAAKAIRLTGATDLPPAFASIFRHASSSVSFAQSQADCPSSSTACTSAPCCLAGRRVSAAGGAQQIV